MNKKLTQFTSQTVRRSIASRLRGLALLLGGLAITAGNIFAEGTKEISNNNANTNSALLVYQSRGTGPFLNNIQENRIKVRIANFNAERIYYGFKWLNYSGNAEIGANVWMRIYDPAGNEVTTARQRFNSTTAGYIADFTQGVNGPNILGVTNGYTPLSFTPTMNGEYSMVFYRVTGTGASSSTDSLASSTNQQFRSSFWDITVANSTEKLNGRVFSQNWGLVAITSTEAIDALSKAAPSFYSYSHDSTLIKLGFVSTTSGFAPIAYDIAFTDYGVDTNTTLSWAQSRKSFQPGSTNVPLTKGFKVFLNAPSATLYPIAQISGTPAFGAVPITGCPGGNLTANYTMPEAGDVRIVFDIDGNGDGYTPNTRDFVLEAFNRPAGPGSITWDGKDGQGNNLVQGTAVKISATYRRGRFNLPIYDAEVNVDGMYIQTIAPLSSPSNRLYWDDASLPTNQTTTTCSDQTANVTGTGLNNSFVGTVSSLNNPTRAWNGNGNLGNVVPAPSVTRGTVQNDANGNQCDDFGNVRVLNTWGWALEADGQLVNVTFGCFTVAGNVFNDVNGKTNNLINQSATGNTPLPALYAYLVSSDSVVRAVTTVSGGTYSFANIPGANYNVVISSTQVAQGAKLNYATQVTLPAAWVNVGEQIGTTANVGIDAIADGILALVLDGNKTNYNFGIQRLPEVGTGANAAANPGGTTQVNVPANTFTNTTASTDYDGGTVSNIRIVAFPANTTTIVINGTSYNNTTWPAAGVLVPANASGAPTQTITVDPNFDGPGTVVITFKSVDNAGQASTANGTATITFGANISGQVWNDANGDALLNNAEKPVSGDKNSTNAGGSIATAADLFASVVNTSDNSVVASMKVNADGTYAFTNIPSGIAYKVILTSGATAPAASSQLSSGSNTTGWVATGVNNNGTASTANTSNVIDLGIVSTNKVNANFGIQRTPTADPKTYSVSNSAFGYGSPSGSLSGFPTLVGYAYIQMSNTAIGALTGTDPEDCPATACSTGSSFRIQSINNRTKLYYDFGGSTGVQEVIAGTSTARIDNFDPAKMVIYAQAGGGAAVTPYAFTYSIIDKAGATSAAATYSITTTTPLPVTLMNFAAKAEGRNVLLTWNTASETNNKGFAVERSLEAKAWKEVIFEASKAVNGNSNEQLDYTTTDKDVTPGNVYYRLKQMDFDGVVSLSEVRMVNIKSTGLSIYPNPASNVVNVIGLAAQHTVSVFDVTGRVMMTAEVDANNNTLSIAGLTDGVYTVVIKNEKGIAGTFKLVKK